MSTNYSDRITVFHRQLGGELSGKRRVLLLPGDQVQQHFALDSLKDRSLQALLGVPQPVTGQFLGIGDNGGPAAIQAQALTPYGGLADQTERGVLADKLVSDPKGATTSWVAQPAFVVALTRAYAFDGPLADYPAGDSMRLAAVLSHFVFDVDADQLVDGPQPGTLAEVEHLALHHQPEVERDQTAGELYELEIDQRAGGIHFRMTQVVVGPDDRPLRPLVPRGDEPAGARTLRVRHAVGSAPGGELPVLTTVLDSLHRDGSRPTWDFVHTLRPDELVGRQLHYRFEVMDLHQQRVGVAGATVYRERLSPPPPPEQAWAELSVADDGTVTVQLRISLRFLQSEEPGTIDVDVLVDERPLDEVGWYGDDDDVALLEGALAEQLDGGGDRGDEGAAAKGDGGDTSIDRLAADNPTLSRLRGAFSRDGLVALPSTPLRQWRQESSGSQASGSTESGDEPGEASLQEGTWTLTLGEDVLPWRPGHGYRFLVGLARRTGLGTVRSELRRAVHGLVLGPNAPEPLPVFQLERFDPVPPPRRFLPADQLDVALAPRTVPSLRSPAAVSPRDPAWQHDLRFVHHSAQGDDARVGGYRVWRRDLVALPGDDDGAQAESPTDQQAIDRARAPDFRQVEDLAVLAPLVAAWRPVKLNAGQRWAVVASTELALGPWNPPPSPAGAPAVHALVALARNIATVHDAVFRGADCPPEQHALPGSLKQEVLDYLSKAPADDDWASLGRALTVLEERGLVADLAVRREGLDLLDDWSGTASLGLPPGIVLMLPTTSTGSPMARVRMVRHGDLAAVMKHTPVGNDPQLVATATTARLLRLSDQASKPATVSLGKARDVRWTWRGLADPWHHDEEWVVELLDRYDRVRALMRQARQDDPQSVAVPPALPAADVTAAQRRRVVVPRTAPVQDLASVTPAPTWRRCSIAFRVSETVERLATTHNAAERTRLGRMQLHLEQRRALTRPQQWDEDLLAVYGRLPDAWADPVQAALAATDAGETWWPALSQLDPGSLHDFDSAASDDNPWRVWRDVPPDVAPVGERIEIVPQPGTDLVTLDHAAWYFTYTLASWLTADDAVGPRSQAEQERRPGSLGLLAAPTVRVESLDDGRFLFRLAWVPPVLASHLEPDELEEARRGPVLRLADEQAGHVAEGGATYGTPLDRATALAEQVTAAASELTLPDDVPDLSAAMSADDGDADADANDAADAEAVLGRVRRALDGAAVALAEAEGAAAAEDRRLADAAGLAERRAAEAQAAAPLHQDQVLTPLIESIPGLEQAAERAHARATALQTPAVALATDVTAAVTPMETLSGLQAPEAPTLAMGADQRARIEHELAVATARAERAQQILDAVDPAWSALDAVRAAIDQLQAAVAVDTDTQKAPAASTLDKKALDGKVAEVQQALEQAQQHHEDAEALLEDAASEADEETAATTLADAAAKAADARTSAAAALGGRSPAAGALGLQVQLEGWQSTLDGQASDARDAAAGPLASAGSDKKAADEALAQAQEQLPLAEAEQARLEQEAETRADEAAAAQLQADAAAARLAELSGARAAYRQRLSPLRRAADNLALPVHLLPDLGLVLSVALDVGGSSRVRLVPLLRLWGSQAPGLPPLEAGRVAAGAWGFRWEKVGAAVAELAASSPLGRVTDAHPALEQQGLELVARCVVAPPPGRAADVLAALAAGTAQPDVVRISLQRGELVSQWAGLVPASPLPAENTDA